MTNNEDSFFYAQGPLATDLAEVGHDSTGLDEPGFWAPGGKRFGVYSAKQTTWPLPRCA